jgi:DNA invertase Pin-like site-specific DNA recombinase
MLADLQRENAMKFIAYYRVSTDKQGQSGLGLEAQRKAVADYLGIKPIKAYTEVESGKRTTNRPKLAEAIQSCRAFKAKLVIAKLDRLSRDAHFLLGLEKAGIDFVAADMPNANRLTVGIMAMVAEEERRMISARTKAALQAAKARGTKLGGDRGVTPSQKCHDLAIEALQGRAAARAADIAPIIRELQEDGADSLRAIATGLNEAGIPTARGQGQWSATQVKRVLDLLDLVQ